MKTSFQDMIHKLEKYWAEYGCVIWYSYDIEKGAGTFNPATFLMGLGPEPWKVGYIEPSRRPTDGRYGDNPNRLHLFFQYQVIIKPSPADSQKIYLDSLRYLGIDLVKHDCRFVEDDWESPTLGATGLGWEVWLDGMEVSQFTYFQQVGGLDVDMVSLELTYGLERLAMFIQGVDNVYNLLWVITPDGKGVTYGEVRQEWERQFSLYSFEESNPEMLFTLFDMYEKECSRLLECESTEIEKAKENDTIKPYRSRVLPAYDYVLKCSHTFNMLQARGVISVAQRTGYIARVRNLAKRCAEAYLTHRKSLGFPLLQP